MIRVKKTFPPKTEMQEKQLLQDPGYVGGVEGPCCMVSCKLYEYYVEGVERNKIIINQYIRLHLRYLFVMSQVSKALYTYINRMRSLPQYVHTVASSLSNSK